MSPGAHTPRPRHLFGSCTTDCTTFDCCPRTQLRRALATAADPRGCQPGASTCMAHRHPRTITHAQAPTTFANTNTSQILCPVGTASARFASTAHLLTCRTRSTQVFKRGSDAALTAFLANCGVIMYDMAPAVPYTGTRCRLMLVCPRI